MGPADQPSGRDDDLLEELNAFAGQDASELDALAARIRELQTAPHDEAPGFDVDAIWSEVEKHMDEADPQVSDDGGAENGSGR